MHPIDMVLIALFLVAFIFGFKKGFIASILTLVGLVTTLVLLARYTPMVKQGIALKFPQLSDFLSGVLAYALIVVAVAVLFFIIRILLEYVARKLSLTLANRVLGAIFALCNLFVVILIFLLVVDYFTLLHGIKDKLQQSIFITQMYKVHDSKIKPLYQDIEIDIQDLYNLEEKIRGEKEETEGE
jgi:uncharacterized membrane protein required for colicin V production